MGDILRNPGYDGRFTCPACLHDFYMSETECPSCHTKVRCRVEHEPVATCEVVDADTEEEDV